MTDDTAPIHTRRRLAWAGTILGFSLGGFFDGILLHQVLQWHHLFSCSCSTWVGSGPSA